MSPWSHALLRPKRRSPHGTLPESATLRGRFDFHDPTQLFQNAAATVPVAAVGDPIARVENQAVGGPPLAAGSAFSRPTWQPFGDGRRGGRYDGVDDYLSAEDAAYWSFLHDGRGAALFLSFHLQDSYDGPLLFNAVDQLGLQLNCGWSSGGASYVSVQVGSGFVDVGEPAWQATTVEGSVLRPGRNTIAVALSRTGIVNTTIVRANGVVGATDGRERENVHDGPATSLYVQSYGSPAVTLGQVLIYETAAMFEAAEQIEGYLLP